MTTQRTLARTLLVDADDTLWENNIFYLRASAAFGEYMSMLGCPSAGSAELLAACERDLIPSFGYGPTTYMRALGMACSRWLIGEGRRASSDVIARAQAFALSVLSPPTILPPEVKETLEALRPSTRLVLVTKGDVDTQRDKLRRSGLEGLFDAIFIVAEKETRTYLAIVRELRLDVHRTWMVGNSPRSDINPALEAGLGAIHIPHDQTWTAEHQEIHHLDRVVVLSRFAELTGFFGARA